MCLGASARATGRGSSQGRWVMSGKRTATVTLEIWNTGRPAEGEEGHGSEEEEDGDDDGLQQKWPPFRKHLWVWSGRFVGRGSVRGLPLVRAAMKIVGEVSQRVALARQSPDRNPHAVLRKFQGICPLSPSQSKEKRRPGELEFDDASADPLTRPAATATASPSCAKSAATQFPPATTCTAAAAAAVPEPPAAAAS